jgi:exosortase
MTTPSPILPLGPGKEPSPPEATPAVPSPTARAVPADEGLVSGLLRRLREFATDLRSPDEAVTWTILAVLTAGLIYSYWPSLTNLPSTWSNPQYQHGWIVPVLTVVLLLWWRKPVAEVTMSARLAGLGLLLASFAIRLGFAFFRVKTFDMYTFVPALAGVFLLGGGWSVFRWAWIPIALLIFMYPLPEGHQRYLTGPLQTFNTAVATFLLQTLGFDAIRDGNLIRLGQDHVMNVVDACAGLKMLTIFVWLAAVVIAVAGLEWWENLVIAVSAIPIAILMMGVAVGFILLEMKLLSYVIVTDEYTPAMVSAAGGGRPAPAVAGPRAGGFPVIPGANQPDARPNTGGKMG